MDLDLNLTSFDVLGAPVHIQHGRLVLLRVRVVDVVVNQACFTDGCVSHENHLDLLWFTRFGFGRDNFRGNFLGHLLFLLLRWIDKFRLSSSFPAALSISRILMRGIQTCFVFSV